MSKTHLPAAARESFESLKQSNEHGAEYWSARKLQPLLGYSQRRVEDYHLSRSCYLIAQNGDPRKPEIAHAQKYFAVQVRRQELSDQAAADVERLELRKQTAEEFKALSSCSTA